MFSEDNAERLRNRVVAPSGGRRSGNTLKTVNEYFREIIDNRFMLNKDPNSIERLVLNMKRDFSNNSEGNGLEPNRVIFFSGASEFYRTLASTPSNEYYKTGWRDGSSFNALEAVVRGMTFCESFDVKQGDFNEDHDPFDDEACSGGFAHVNRDLYKHQLDGTKLKFNSRALNIKTLNGGSDTIDEMSYSKFLPFTGTWSEYHECINTDGRKQSRLTSIGEAVFGANETYGEVMKQVFRGEYSNRVKSIAQNKGLLDAIRATHNLGFTETEDDSESSPPSSPRVMSDDDDGDFDNQPLPSMSEARHSKKKKNKRKAQSESEDSEEEEAPSRRSSAKRVHIVQHSNTPMDKLFRGYLKKQTTSLTSTYDKMVSRGIPGGSGKSDPAVVAWKAMSDDLLGGQLLTSARKVKSLGHLKFPPTAVELKALEMKSWRNDTQESTQELDDADSHSLRWSPPEDSTLEVFLNPRLTVTAELHQAGAALTLTSVNSVLFKISPEMMTSAVNRGTTKVDLSKSDKVDRVSTKSQERIARLQHSANLSYAFEAVREAIANSSGDSRHLFHADEQGLEQKKLVEKLRKLFHSVESRVKKVADERLPSSSLQWPLRQVIHAATTLIKVLYHGPSDAPDRKIALACKPVVDFLHGHYTAEEEEEEEDSDDDENSDGDEDMETSGTSALYRPGKKTVTAVRLLKHTADLTAAQITHVLRMVEAVNKEGSRVLTNSEKAFLQRKSVDNKPKANLSYMRATDLVKDGLNNDSAFVQLYRHFISGINLPVDVADRLLVAILNVGESLYMKSPIAFDGVDPSAVYDNLIAHSCTRVRDVSEAEVETKTLETDKQALDTTITQDKVKFGDVSVVGEIVQQLLQERRERQIEISFLQNQVDRLNEVMHPVTGGDAKESAKTGIAQKGPKNYSFAHGEKEKVHELLQTYVNKKNKTDDAWLDVLKGHDTPHLIAGIQIYRAVTEGDSIAENSEALEKANLSRRVLTKLNDLVNQGWAEALYLPSRRGGGGGEDTKINSEDDATITVDRMLMSVSLHDCRLHALFVQHGEEPLLGLLYFWPHIRLLGSHAAMVKDGAVGNVFYIDPDILLSENGQQKIIFYHMSMYFKAMVTNFRALTRAHYVYCRQVLGGYNHTAWDPLSELDVSMVRGNRLNGTASGKSMFVIPTLINRSVEASHMSLPGRFGNEYPILPDEKRTTEFEVADVLNEIWLWNPEDMVSSFDPSKSKRLEAAESPFNNLIMSQTHQESYDIETRKFSHVIGNKGDFGEYIYDGCMKAWNSNGRLQQVKGSLEMQLVRG